MCSYHLYKSLSGKLFNAHYSIVVITQHCIYTNLHDDDDDDDDDDETLPTPLYDTIRYEMLF